MIAILNINSELFDNNVDETLTDCLSYVSYNKIIEIENEDDLKEKLRQINEILLPTKEKASGN